MEENKPIFIEKDEDESIVKGVIENFDKKEDVLGYKIHVQNDGYVQLVDYMGDDARVVEAARESYGNLEGELTEEKIKGMLHTMITNGHTSPFEQVVFTFKLRMPIFVARQWIRSRTARLNECSMRYMKNSGKMFVPDLNTSDLRTDPNGDVLSDDEVKLSDETKKEVEEANEAAFEVYNKLIDKGVPKEIARTVLPVGMYTEFIWQMDMNNLMLFFTRRLEDHAQRETFEYATAVAILVRMVCPNIMNAFFKDRFSTISIDYSQSCELVAVLNEIHSRINNGTLKVTSDNCTIVSKLNAIRTSIFLKSNKVSLNLDKISRESRFLLGKEYSESPAYDIIPDSVYSGGFPEVGR